MSWAFDAVNELGDIVEIQSRAQLTEAARSHFEASPRRLLLRHSETAANGFVDRFLERFTITPRLGF